MTLTFKPCLIWSMTQLLGHTGWPFHQLKVIITNNGNCNYLHLNECNLLTQTTSWSSIECYEFVRWYMYDSSSWSFIPSFFLLTTSCFKEIQWNTNCSIVSIPQELSEIGTLLKIREVFALLVMRKLKLANKWPLNSKVGHCFRQ